MAKQTNTAKNQSTSRARSGCRPRRRIILFEKMAMITTKAVRNQCAVWLILRICSQDGLTPTLTGPGERMRASGPVERVVIRSRHPAQDHVILAEAGTAAGTIWTTDRRHSAAGVRRRGSAAIRLLGSSDTRCRQSRYGWKLWCTSNDEASHCQESGSGRQASEGGRREMWTQ